MTRLWWQATKYLIRLRRHSWYRQIKMTMRSRVSYIGSRRFAKVAQERKGYRLNTAAVIFGWWNLLLKIRVKESRFSEVSRTFSNSYSVVQVKILFGLFRSTLKNHFYLNRGNLISEFGPFSPINLNFLYINKDIWGHPLTTTPYQTKTTTSTWQITAYKSLEIITANTRKEIP